MNSQDHQANTDPLVNQRRLSNHRKTDWVCGYAELGKCCANGPTANGRCSRDEADCDELPPCVPQRSYLGRRQALRMNVAALTGGLLLLCMALPARQHVFVPGELSGRHAQILDNTLVVQRCSLCHPDSHDGAGDQDRDDQRTQTASFLARAFADTAMRIVHNDGRQDKLCMQCHSSHMPLASLRQPHDLSAEMWSAVERDKNGQPAWQLVSAKALDSLSGGVPAETQEPRFATKTSCATCHVEHHGRQFDLKLISDAKCQGCHRRAFESLAAGHPEFTSYPAHRPNALAFSHARHADEHFPKKNRDFDCRACHLDVAGGGASGAIVPSLAFEQACADCHAAAITAASATGWAVLQLPSIEAPMTKSDAALTRWPTTARYGIDGVVSPVTRALLMADDQISEEMKHLPPSGNLVDISTISDRRSQVARAVATGIGRLVDDTARLGQAAWIGRLEKVLVRHLRRDLNEQEQQLLRAMCRGVPPDLFRQIQSSWFVDKDPSTQPAPASAPGPRGRDTLELQPSRSPASTPAGDDLLSPDSLDEPGNLAIAVGSEDGKLRSVLPDLKGATHVTQGGWYLDQTTLSVCYMPSGHADATLAAWTMWWSIIESEPQNSRDGSLLGRSIAVSHRGADATGGLAMPLQVPGGCAQCHILAPAPASTSHDAWRSWRRLASEKGFTRFDHSPHLTLPALRDCRYCHRIDDPRADPVRAALRPLETISTTLVASSIQLPVAGTAHQLGLDRSQLAGRGRHSDAGEFATMQLQQCVACHRPDGAGDGCLQCHNYHVNTHSAHPE